MVEFAKHLGTDHSIVSKYESDKIKPSRSMLLLLLHLAKDDERRAILDALGVDREHQEGWMPGELEHELEGFETYLRAGGRKEFHTDSPRRRFLELAKAIGGDRKKSVPGWLVEVLEHWMKHQEDPKAIEYFEHLPIYLDVRLRTVPEKDRPVRQPGARQSGRN